MNGNEDTKIIVRGVEKKLLETMLLVLGLAFGIGAAAAGIALAARSVTAAREELASPQYREILVATRAESEEMDVPLLLRETRNRTVLTSIDLKAAQEAPDVAFSYVKSNERFNNMAMMVRQFQERQAQAATGSQTGTQGAAQSPAGTRSQAGTASGPVVQVQNDDGMMIFGGPGAGGPPPEGAPPAGGAAAANTDSGELPASQTASAPAANAAVTGETAQSATGTQASGNARIRTRGETGGQRTGENRTTETSTGTGNVRQAQAAAQTGTSLTGNAQSTSGMTPAENTQSATGAAQTGNARTVQGRQAPEPFDFSQLDLSGPQPILEEWYGYQVTPEYFSAWNLQAEKGSVFTVQDIKNGGNQMILGSGLAKTLYEDGESLGRKPMSGRTIYTITGILEPTGTILDNLAFVPTFMPDVQGNIQEGGFFRGGWNSTLSFMVNDPDRLDEAADQLRTYFTRTYGEGNFIMTIPREEAQATRDRNERTVTLILFLALTGLFIAGVNVSNTLLSHAMKRQKTVGVLKALGASKNRIFRLFLTEAFITGTLGTAVGTGFSILLSWLIARSTNLTGTRPLELALGILLAWIITSVLIIFPSMQAARIPAAEAMRTE